MTSPESSHAAPQHLPVIDAHHHFWIYDPVEYGWIDDQMSVIRRNFLPADLEAVIHQVGVDGVVSVQARETVEETRWLLDLASKHSFMRGVVGWVPLTDPDVHKSLAEFTRNPALKSVRHGLQGEADPLYMLRDDFNAGIRVLQHYQLAYDILIYERQLPQTIKFVDRHPQQIFIVDHLAKPRVKDALLSPWRENMRELAKREHVYCKISGLVTEADFHHWTEASLQPYIDTVLETFGPRRAMFGSDWPVCLVACPYDRWLHIVSKAASKLSPDERAQLMGGTATRAYRL